MTIVRAILKAVSGLPNRVPAVSGRSNQLGGLGSLLSGSSAQSGMSAYTGIGAVYGPIRRLCESVALVDWKLYQQTETAGSIDRELVDDATAPARHPATALWTMPNPFMSRRQFLYLHQLWQETAGGCYWLICQGGAGGSPFLQQGAKADLELWPIRPDRITPITDPDKYVSGYVYTLGIEKIPLPVQAVIPIGWPDPNDPLKFAGPLQSMGVDLEGETYAAQYNRNTFLNNGEPGGVIEFEVPLAQDRFDELVLRWREQHQGLNNAKRVAIIEGGKWVETGQKNSEMEFLKGRQFTQEEVMYTLGMPFAVMVTREVNLANAQVALKLYYSLAVRPRLESVKEPLNLRVLPYLGENLTMDFELPVPTDEAFDVYASATGWLAGLLSKNEAREGLGYGSLGPEGDQYAYELSGLAPQIPPPPKPPRRPTALSYRGAVKRVDMATEEAQMTDAWAKRLQLVGEQYAHLLAARNNGSGH